MSKLHFLVREYIEKYYPLFGPAKVAEKLGMSSSSITVYAKKNNLILNKVDGIGLEIPKLTNEITIKLSSKNNFNTDSYPYNNRKKFTFQIFNDSNQRKLGIFFCMNISKKFFLSCYLHKIFMKF